MVTRKAGKTGRSMKLILKLKNLFCHRVSLAYSPDGEKVVTLGYDGELRTWTGATWERFGTLVPPSYMHGITVQ